MTAIKMTEGTIFRMLLTMTMLPPIKRRRRRPQPRPRLKQSSEMLSPRRHLVTDATIVSEGHKLPWLCCRMLLIQLLHLVKLLLLMLLVIDRVSGEEDYDYDDKMMLMMMTMTLMMMTMTRIRV
eukprot:s5449_g9.t1